MSGELTHARPAAGHWPRPAAGEPEDGELLPTAAARAYLAAARSANTKRGYRADWAHFTTWCAAQEPAPAALPASPATVALYLAEHAPIYKVSTLVRRVSAIAAAHAAAGHPSPTADVLVRATLAGVRRVHGTAAEGKAPLVTAEIRRLLDQLPSGPGKALPAARDRALLLLGFAGAFRRSELVGLDVRDVQSTGDGLVVRLRRSKTDQDAAGRTIGIPYGSDPASCPVRTHAAWVAALRGALEAWVGHALEEDTFAERPLFSPISRHGRLAPTRLSDRAVALIVQRYAERAGLDPANYAGHSLRAGFASAAAAAGASERSIMAQTGHRSLPMVRRYIREGSLFRDNAAAQLGL